MATDEDRIKSNLYNIAKRKIRRNTGEGENVYLKRIIDYVEYEYCQIRYGFSMEPTYEDVERARLSPESVESYEIEIADRVDSERRRLGVFKKPQNIPPSQLEESVKTTTEFIKRNSLGVRLRRLFNRRKKEEEVGNKEG